MRPIATTAMLVVLAAALGPERCATGQAAAAAGDAERLQAPAGSPWLHRGGRPFLPVGDSLTQGWTELGTDFDQTAYLDALARRGINATLIWSYIGAGDPLRDARIGYDARPLWPWVEQAGRFDLARFNPAYFDRLRAFVVGAEARGIVVVITVHDGWTKTRFAGHPFNQARGGPLTHRTQYVELLDPEREIQPGAASDRRGIHQERLERFCEHLIAVTGDLPNVVYEMFNEGEWYDPAALRAFQEHFLRFFTARTRQPLAVNDDSHGRGRGYREAAGIGLITLHTPRWDDQPGAAVFTRWFARENALRPVRPVLFSEPVPEFTGDAPRLTGLTRLIWGTALGGAGVVVQNDTSWGFAPRAAIRESAAVRDALLDREGIAARFFNDPGLDLASLRPAPELASTGACLAAPGQTYIVYAEADRDGNAAPFTLDLTTTPKAETPLVFQPTWLDPHTGARRVGPVVTGGAIVRLRGPSPGDAVLHLVRQPPPGPR